MSDKNYFQILNEVDVSDKKEKKNNLDYLSWANAWAEVKKRFPDTTFTVYENKDGWNYHTDGRTCWVKTGVTVNGIEHVEYLPVMDFKNKSIPLANVTSYEVNKAIQRSLTKAVARHGLGLYIYAGEDLPEETDGKNSPNSSVKGANTASNTQGNANPRVDEKNAEKSHLAKELFDRVVADGVDADVAKAMISEVMRFKFGKQSSKEMSLHEMKQLLANFESYKSELHKVKASGEV